MVDVSTVEHVDLREVWPSEAADFTPWLTENLEYFGNVLGFDLELREREAEVGTFSLDILAHDVGRDRPVIIENQLERTDHDHLGKLLTYAAGYDAGVIVWLAREIREEHREALDWLNHRTDSDTQFFGVVVELLKIDGSRPAPNFRLVAFPNEWRKEIATVSRSAAGTKRGQMYQEYFQNVLDELKDEHSMGALRPANNFNWCSINIGIPNVYLTHNFPGRNLVRVSVNVDGGSLERSKTIFESLLENRTDIESESGLDLIWEGLGDNRKIVHLIHVISNGSYEGTNEDIENTKSWAVKNIIILRDILRARLTTPKV